MQSPTPIGYRLEQYTLKHPREVLLVTATVEGDDDQIVIFRGVSSSLMRSTAFDPDVPVLPDDAIIQSIDRLEGPYHPAAPHYIQQDISWSAMQLLLEATGV